MGNEKETVVIEIPESFTFYKYDSDEFDKFLSFFDWSLKDKKLDSEIHLILKMSENFFSKNTALIISLLILYIECLFKTGIKIEFSFDGKDSINWEGLDEEPTAKNWKDFLKTRIDLNNYKVPLIIRSSEDRKKALEFGKTYTENLNLEYEKTLRYLLNELLYNTLEHGKNEHDTPSLLQFSWNKELNEISFITADVGIGIRKHLRQTYPNLATDVEAIIHSIKPQVSGTFGMSHTGYETINNAGVGLFFSSNIAQKLDADMFIVSGNGFVHISPNEIISKELEHQWKGTFVYVKIKLGLIEDLNLQKMISEITKSIPKTDKDTENNNFYFSVRNYFGRYAEDKDLAKKIRDEKILPALAENKTVTLDFEEIISAPHSLLNAMLATPIERLGLAAYKKIKIINAAPEIRETLDFIFDDNTSNA